MTKKTTSNEAAVTVNGVAKYFNPSKGQRSIKNAFTSMFRKRKDSFMKDGYWALKDVNFEVKKGEFFGIVGRNGSGKSTLLKMIAGVYLPSKGGIRVNGKLVPFIELGVGFNPELTGRDNVFLNGALLGFSRKETAAMYDEIVSFAELEEHMDVKLKNFSSGMQVRLAFSIAIRAKSDVLLIDEVLAVGDEAFQQKCIDVFEKYKREKQTVILVTHDMQTMRKFCDRAILLEDGLITLEGESNKVAAAYSKLNNQLIAKDLEEKNSSPQESSIKLEMYNSTGALSSSFKVNEQMTVKISWPKSMKNVKNVGLAIIKNSGEFMFGSNTIGTNPVLSNNNIEHKLELNLGPGKYYLMAGLFGDTARDIITFLERGPQVILVDDPNSKLDGMVRLNYKWLGVDDGKK